MHCFRAVKTDPERVGLKIDRYGAVGNGGDKKISALSRCGYNVVRSFIAVAPKKYFSSL
jgi:hypothetical protein